MKADKYDYVLPHDLIALRPLEKRDESRLLVQHKSGAMEHRRFYELPELLNPGDIVIANKSKVFPALLVGQKPTGGRLKILLVRQTSENAWDILSKEKYTGSIKISEHLSALITEGSSALFSPCPDLMDRIREAGAMPLPPYIKRAPDIDDRTAYQTVYAEHEGSIAAPTAGLHFTQELIERLRARSVHFRTITLHVGAGTFRPLKAENVEDHEMEDEFFEIDPELLSEIHKAKSSGKKVVAVGTTTTRALEGHASGTCRIFSSNGSIKGATGIFIQEGYSFRVVDALITNLHLPRSTPLVLVSAFAGREQVLNAYKSATSMRYRFFSYGDAMLLL